MCVGTTVRATFDFGFQCITVHDACAPKDLIFNGDCVPAATVQAAYMGALHGIFTEVITAELACNQLAE